MVRLVPAHVFQLMCIHFLIAFAELILVVPLFALFERSICFAYYASHDPGVIVGGTVPEALCKVTEVQQDLAIVRGWKSFFDIIPVILVAIAVGKLGDKYGRRNAMAVSLIGMMGSLVVIFTVCALYQTVNVRLVWLSSVCLLLGGGLYTSAALMWAMASEVCNEEERSSAYYHIFSAFYIAELVGSFIASVTTDISPWIPCGLSFGSLIACILVLYFMPFLQCKISQNIDLMRSIEDTPLVSPSLVSIFSNPIVALSAPVFIVGTLRYSTLGVLIQYASVRFDYSISSGGLFYTETAFVNIFLFLFLVPRVTEYFRERRSIRPKVLDLATVKISLGLLCIGALCIGLAPIGTLLLFGVFLFASGFGSRVCTLSFASHFVADGSMAKFYASVAILENLGHAVADPGLQHIFAAALGVGGFWLATPFFAVAALYALAGFGTTFIILEKNDDDGYTHDRDVATASERDALIPSHGSID